MITNIKKRGLLETEEHIFDFKDDCLLYSEIQRGIFRLRIINNKENLLLRFKPEDFNFFVSKCMKLRDVYRRKEKKWEIIKG